MLVAWLLLAAVVLFVWLGLFVAVAMMGIARFCEIRDEHRLSQPNFPPRPEWSTSDAKFLSACGIGFPRRSARSNPMAHRLH